MQDQGRIDEAKLALYHALTISRNKNITSCIGFASVTLSHLRITQAILLQKKNHYSSDAKNLKNRGHLHYLLKRARTSLRHALDITGLEAETHTEGLLALAQASFSLGEIDIAQEQVKQAIDEAQRYEQTWLLACAQRLVGNILSARELFGHADARFSQALEILRKCGMRLEEARTMHSLGESLLQRADKDSLIQGFQYLQEARNTFEQCHAIFDS